MPGALAFTGLLALAAGAVLADRGGGSIRGAARSAPAPAHADDHREQNDAHHDQPAVRHDQPDVHHDAPDPHRDDHPAPAPPPRRDWDDNDDDARHFGGYAHGEPAHLRGERIHDLPSRHFDVVFNNQHYFWDGGGEYYLLQTDGQYLVVQPPVGVIVASPPDGTVSIQSGPTNYFYLDGVFYINQDNGYVVVNPPPGIVVPSLPSGASQTVINGNVTYQFNGFNYQPMIQDGVTVFVVNPS